MLIWGGRKARKGEIRNVYELMVGKFFEFCSLEDKEGMRIILEHIL
jgi:hypothetical protein